ncbi:hypothetical protein C8R43DRAFT_969004 [Mycena crocata]|nr:hypothetical protein C8R43DRAFT_969004 [Mycena crocata]
MTAAAAVTGLPLPLASSSCENVPHRGRTPPNAWPPSNSWSTSPSRNTLFNRVIQRFGRKVDGDIQCSALYTTSERYGNASFPVPFILVGMHLINSSCTPLAVGEPSLPQRAQL